MRITKRLFLLLALSGVTTGWVAAQAGPFAEQTYRKYSHAGKTDAHFYIGAGMSNFDNAYIPLNQDARGLGSLSFALDMVLGAGYYVIDFLSLGLESGVSLNWGGGKNSYYHVENIASVGPFWNWATPAWMRYYGYRVGIDQAELTIFNTEIPIRFYTKLSPFGSSVNWITLQGFVGFDLAFTNVKTYFYKQRAGGSFFYDSLTQETFFAPDFTAGARLSIAFISVEYSYHLGLNDNYKNWDYYKNRTHRLSVGFTINGVF